MSTGLEVGGAEVMLYKLLSGIDQSVFNVSVISLLDIGRIGARIQELGIPVRALRMRVGTVRPTDVLRLVRWLREDRPDVVQTWMYHADLIGGLAAACAGRIPTAWNIQNSTLDPGYSKRTTIWTARLCAWTSSWMPRRIVCCAEASRRVHVELGYAAARMTVIPNAFELDRFRPDPAARISVREELNVPPHTRLIGLVARYDPQKDHRTFVTAARLLHAELPDVHFVLVGHGVAPQNAELSRWLGDAGIAHRAHLLGHRDDISRLDAAFDLLTLTSAYGEGLPNVLGEAMACGVPCVVTDVGDSALVVGDTGLTVPVRAPQALADAWRQLLLEGPDRLAMRGRDARHRISAKYSLPATITQYEAMYRELAAPQHAA